MMFPKPQRRKKVRQRVRASMPESALQKTCEAYLDVLDLPYIRIPDTMNSIVFGSSYIPVHVKRMISAFTKGVPDLTILHPEGMFLCVELKTESGKQSQAQKAWSKRVAAHYHIIRSFEDFKTLVNTWLTEMR